MNGQKHLFRPEKYKNAYQVANCIGDVNLLQAGKAVRTEVIFTQVGLHVR